MGEYRSRYLVYTYSQGTTFYMNLLFQTDSIALSPTMFLLKTLYHTKETLLSFTHMTCADTCMHPQQKA